jgi:hypothetical protein
MKSPAPRQNPTSLGDARKLYGTTPKLDGGLKMTIGLYVTVVMVIYLYILFLVASALSTTFLAIMFTVGMAMITAKPLVKVLFLSEKIWSLRSGVSHHRQKSAIKLANQEFGWRPRSGVNHPEGSLDRWDRWFPIIESQGGNVAFVLEQWHCGVDNMWILQDRETLQLLDSNSAGGEELGEARESLRIQAATRETQSHLEYNERFLISSQAKTNHQLAREHQDQSHQNAARMARLLQ